MKEVPNEMPFKYPLEAFEYRDYLKLMKEFPDKIIREDSSLKKTEDMIKAIKLMHELKVYGINVPVQHVIAKNEKGKKTIYSIADKIKGRDLIEEQFDNIDEKERKELLKKLDNLYASWLKYLKDKYIKQEAYLWDVTDNRQYIYGKKESQEKKDIYLIDTDLWFEDLKEFKDQFISAVEVSIQSAIEMDIKIGLELKKTKEELKKLYKILDDEDKKELYYWMRQETSRLDLIEAS